MLALFMVGLIMLIIGFCIIKENTPIGVILLIFGAAFLNAVASIGY